MKAAMCCIAVLLLACLSSARAGEKREQTYIVGADIDAQAPSPKHNQKLVSPNRSLRYSIWRSSDGNLYPCEAHIQSE